MWAAPTKARPIFFELSCARSEGAAAAVNAAVPALRRNSRRVKLNRINQLARQPIRRITTCKFFDLQDQKPYLHLTSKFVSMSVHSWLPSFSSLPSVKSRLNVSRMKSFLVAALSCIVLASAPAQPSFTSRESGDAAFEKVADEYLTGYLRWRPETGTALGFHEYDGKVTDLSKPSLDIELSRLKSFERRLATLDTRAISQ